MIDKTQLALEQLDDMRSQLDSLEDMIKTKKYGWCIVNLQMITCQCASLMSLLGYLQAEKELGKSNLEKDKPDFEGAKNDN